MKKLIRKLCSAVLCLTLLLSLIPANVNASGLYDYDEKGSITMHLHDLGTPMENTKFALYQVGTVTDELHLAFGLTSDFAGSGVDLNTLNTAAMQKDAIGVFENMLPGSPMEEAVADSTGKIVFTNLAHGVYMLCQTDTAAYGAVSPLLIFLPHMNEDHDDWVHHVVTHPKGEALQKYSLKIAKNVKYEGVDYSVTDTFYATLFYDAAYTQPASEVIKLELNKAASTTATFSDLLAGTYYLAETDQDGNVIDTSLGTFNYTNEITSDGVVSIPHQGTDMPTITNHLKAPPQDPLYECDITINKKVMKEDDAHKVTDTFYFTVFEDEGKTQAIETKPLSLEKASAGTVVFTGLIEGTYYIAETDQDGKVLGSKFAYEVEVSQSEVSLSQSNRSAVVEIVNTLKEEEQSESETETQKQKTPPGGKTTTTTTIRKTTSANSVKTGDHTTVVYYIILAGAALVVMIGVAMKKKRYRRS